MRLELERVTLRHGARPALLENLDLVIEPDELIVVRGPSGSGKSSLLRLIVRLAEPSAGRILVDGVPVVDLEPTALRRRIGYVQQTPVLIEGTIRDNLVLPFTFKAARGARPPGDDELAAELAACGLSGLSLDDDAGPLSVGQKQRIALLRALFCQPELLLCDEPTSALDDDSAARVDSRLDGLHRERGVAILLVTHVASRLEQSASRRLILASAGLREATA